MSRQIGFIVFLILFSRIINSQVLPEDRRIEWSPGIAGGIPEISSPVLNIIDFGADPNGVEDSYRAIESTIDSLPETGGIVFIPKGNFRVTSAIKIKRDNMVMRGEGPSSKLLMETYGNSVEITCDEKGSWQKIKDGFLKNSKIITIEDGTKFKAGQFAEIEQDNNPDVMYTDPEWNQPWAENSVGQLFEVAGIDGNRITLKTPLHIDFSPGLNVRARPVNMIKNVGFENFYIEKKVANGHTFYFSNSAYCWMYKVESNRTRRSHVSLAQSLANTIKLSYFHHSSYYGGGGGGYGVECGFHTTDVLTEDNVFDSLRHAMMVQTGANGNVFAYNFSTNPVQGENTSNLNEGWKPPDISVHGHYPFMNLFESNEVNEIGIGDYWGPAGPGNTFFRNKVSGEGIFLYDHSDKQNLVGNETNIITDNSDNCVDLITHGNIVSNRITWDPELDKALPPSFYLGSFPDFFFRQYWPIFGPDILRPLKLPARVRHEYGYPTILPETIE